MLASPSYKPSPVAYGSSLTNRQTTMPDITCICKGKCTNVQSRRKLASPARTRLQVICRRWSRNVIVLAFTPLFDIVEMSLVSLTHVAHAIAPTGIFSAPMPAFIGIALMKVPQMLTHGSDHSVTWAHHRIAACPGANQRVILATA
jgi:hypothetical protein